MFSVWVSCRTLDYLDKKRAFESHRHCIFCFGVVGERMSGRVGGLLEGQTVVVLRCETRFIQLVLPRTTFTL